MAECQGVKVSVPLLKFLAAQFRVAWSPRHQWLEQLENHLTSLGLREQWKYIVTPTTPPCPGQEGTFLAFLAVL